MKENLRTCPICGEKFMSRHREQQYCSRECKDKANKIARIQKAANEATARALERGTNAPVVGKTLADWVREAAECNMDYGNYRAQIEHFGKTYEQLKATADRRQMPNHARGYRGVGHLG